MIEDLSVFFNLEEFAVSATLAGVAGVVIFSENGIVADEFGVQTSEPTASFMRTQWPAAAEGQTLMIGAKSYLVRAVTPNSDGALADLRLARL